MFVTPLVKLVLCLVVGLFYAYALSCIIAIMQDKQDRQEDDSAQVGFTVFFAFMWLLLLFTFYYMMTFTIAVVCSHWYYGLQGRSSLATAYRWIFTRQFGSLVFGAFVIAVVTLVRMAVDARRRNRNNNIAAAVCLCLLSCLIKLLEDLLKVLNHYNVIMMAITGESYIESAKSTMGLLWRELGMLQITSIICNFLILWGLILSVGVPCILSYLLMRDKPAEDIGPVIALVAVLSLLLSMVVFELIVESVGCIFIFYSLDKQFIERGLIQASHIPQQTYEQINRYSANPYGTEDNYNKA